MLSTEPGAGQFANLGTNCACPLAPALAAIGADGWPMKPSNISWVARQSHRLSQVSFGSPRGSGFEGELDSLRGLRQKYQDERHANELKTFESMPGGMFNTMNSSYSSIRLEPGAIYQKSGRSRTQSAMCRALLRDRSLE